MEKRVLRGLQNYSTGIMVIFMHESSRRSSCKKKFYGCTQQIMSLLYLADVFNVFGHVEKIVHGNKLFTFYLTTHIVHLLTRDFKQR